MSDQHQHSTDAEQHAGTQTAVVQRNFGGPEHLVAEQVPVPSAADLGPGEVLVRTAAASINPIDVMTREGQGMAATGLVTLPWIPGWDASGTVLETAADVDGLTEGQRVMGLLRFPHPGQAYAQYVVARAEDLVAVPENLDDDQAAALPLAAMTAWQAFQDTAQVQSGMRVLINGASGGVGHLAVQLAHHLGAETVAVASASRHDWLRELGADRTVDYRDQEAMASLRGSVDLAYGLSASSHRAALDAVKPGGTLIALVADEALGQEAEQRGVRFASTHVRTERSWLESVADLAAQGVLVPHVSRTFPLEDAAQAHQEIETGHTQGKIVLRTR